MAHRRFDALAKSLSSAPSRRGLLAAALAASLGIAGNIDARPEGEGKAGGRDGGKAHGRNRDNGHGNGRNRKGKRGGRGGGAGADRLLRYGAACLRDGQCATGRCAGGFCGCASAADCPGDGPVCQDNGTCTISCVPFLAFSRCPLPGCDGCTYLIDVERVCRGSACLPETIGCGPGSADCPFGSVCGESPDAACCGGNAPCLVCFPLGDVCAA